MDHDYRGRLGDDNPIVNLLHDTVIAAGARNRAEAAHVLDHLPAGYGEPTADERAAVLDRFDS